MYDDRNEQLNDGTSNGTLEPGVEPGTSPDAAQETQGGPAPADANERERALLARLRAALLQSEPAIPGALVHGESLEELEASFAAAREALQRVREEVVREQRAIPAGAPGRVAVPLTTPLAKIRAGLDRLA